MPVTQSAQDRWRFAAFVLFLAATSAIAYFGFRHLDVKAELTPEEVGRLAEEVRRRIAAWGALAPAVFLLLFAARPFLFFPSTVLFIAAGLAFGPLLGTLYAVIGATAAGLLTFGIARLLGREFVQARLPERMRRFQQDRWGAGLVFFLNLVPIVPITAVNYTAGLSRMSLSGYTLAVIGGITPRAFAYSFFGDALLDLGSPRFFVAVALIALLVIVPASLRSYYLARRGAAANGQ